MFLIFSNHARAEGDWRVRPQVSAVPGTKITVARVLDAQDLSPETQRQLAQTVLAEAGPEGAVTVINQAQITATLRPILAKERERSKRKVHLRLPQQLTILSEVRALSDEAVTADLLKAWQPICPDCHLEIENLSLPNVKEAVDWSLKVNSELPRGSFSLPLSVTRANKPMVSAWVMGRLVIKRKVPVVTRAIGMHERLQPQDIDWDYRDTSFSLDSAPTLSELKGKKVKQGMRVGDILWRALIEKEKAIHRGEQVQVRSGQSGWEVWLSVVAQQDAAVGDVIEFKNPKTNGTFLGEVVGPARVELR